MCRLLALLLTAAGFVASTLFQSFALAAPWDGGTRAYVSVTAGTGVLIGDLFGDGLDTPVNVRVGAWGVVGDHVHLGGFIGYRYEHGSYESPCTGEYPGYPWIPGGRWRADSMVVGASGRFGASVAASTWLGFALDAGVVALQKLHDSRKKRTTDGVSAYFFPAMALVFLHPVGPVSLGIDAQLGVEMVVGGGLDGVINSCDTSYGAMVFTFGPMAHVGLAVGF